MPQYPHIPLRAAKPDAKRFVDILGGTTSSTRLAVLGGVDINILSGKTPEDVRARVRELILTCGPAGRYAVGSGNSVPSYVPIHNYLAMIDETHATNLS